MCVVESVCSLLKSLSIDFVPRRPSAIDRTLKGSYSSTFCFTSTEARWLIRDGDGRGVGGEEDERAQLFTNY